MINKFVLFGIGGIAVAGTGTGLGVYYGTKESDAGSGQQKVGSQEQEGQTASTKPEVESKPLSEPSPQQAAA